MNNIKSNTNDESNNHKMDRENKNRNSSSSTKNRSHAEGSFVSFSDQHQSTKNTATININLNEIVSGIVLPIVTELKELKYQLSDVSDKLDALCENKVVVVTSQPKNNKRAQPDQEEAILNTVASSSSKRSKVTTSSRTSKNDVIVENENKDIIMKEKLSTTTTTSTTSKNPQEQKSEENYFNCFPNEILLNILEFEGKRSYIIFGLINKRCNAIFKIYKILKLSFVWGYGPLKVIQERKKKKAWEAHQRISKGIIWYKRMDVLNWLIEDVQENVEEHSFELQTVTRNAMKESSIRYDILHEIFDRVYGEVSRKIRRDCTGVVALAAKQGNLELIKWLRQYKFDWCDYAWCEAKKQGQDHVLQYMKDNDYPERWQKDNFKDIYEYDSDSD